MVAAVGKAQRRAEILAAAGRVFARRGYPAATIDEIAGEAGVARGTFYLYFKDRRAVFEALVDGFFEALREAVRPIEVGAETPPLEQLRANLVRAARLVADHPEMVKIAVEDASGVGPELDERLEAFWQQVLDLVERSLAQGQALGLVRDGDVALMAHMSLGMLKGLLLAARRPALALTPERLADEALAFAARGVLRAS